MPDALPRELRRLRQARRVPDLVGLLGLAGARVRAAGDAPRLDRRLVRARPDVDPVTALRPVERLDRPLRVAVAVERDRPERSLQAARREQLRDDVLAGPVRAGDRVEQDLRRRCGEHRPVAEVARALRLAEGADEARGRRDAVPRRDRCGADDALDRRGAGQAEDLVVHEPSLTTTLTFVLPPSTATLSFRSCAALLSTSPARYTAVGARRLDPRHQLRIALAVLLPAVVADDGEAERPGRAPRTRRRSSARSRCGR